MRFAFRRVLKEAWLFGRWKNPGRPKAKALGYQLLGLAVFSQG
jgi:hypothetical protein